LERSEVDPYAATPVEDDDPWVLETEKRMSLTDLFLTVYVHRASLGEGLQNGKDAVAEDLATARRPSALMLALAVRERGIGLQRTSRPRHSRGGAAQ
jgi:hypothetical protein